MPNTHFSPGTMDIKTLDPHQRALVLKIAVESRWSRSQIEGFLHRLDEMVLRRPGRESLDDILVRALAIIRQTGSAV